MDQYPFEINLTIVGCDLENFRQALINAGFENQLREFDNQVEEQLNPEKTFYETENGDRIAL